jgi:ankyrin repeat protein
MLTITRSLTLSAVVWLVVGSAAAEPDRRLADAVERKDFGAVRTLLKARADVNGRQHDGATALHWAAHWDDIDTARLLPGARADVHAANDHGVTPLALACENGSGAMVELLLEAGAKPNAAVSSGETALMTAARTGSLTAVRALLTRGASVNTSEPSHGQTALMWAVANRHAHVVRALVDGGADVHARARSRVRMVHTGSRFGDRGADKGAFRMELGGFTPLLFAARQGDVDSATPLLAGGASLNDTAPNGASALAIAALSGRGAFALFLLDKGADPNLAGAGYAPLHAAVLRSDGALVEALLARGADPNARLTKGTPSRYYSKDYALGEALIGATPLWLAARYGDVAILKTLAAGGASVGHAMPDGTTALMAAIAANSGFGVGNRREQYLSPADAAARIEGEEEKVTFATVQAALDLGADVAATNKAGDTALHLAAGQGVSSVAQLLVEKGAALDVKNKRGLTPLGVATAPRPRGPLAPTGPDSRAGTAELLRRLGAK